MTPSWQERLRAGGHRVTPQRTAILAAIETMPHPTADSIYEHVHGAEPALNRSTVYRTLQVLQDMGLITHAHLGSGPPVYHLADEPPHLHLVCLSCRRVVSLPVTEAEPFAAAVRRSTGFAIDITHSAIYGTCAQCLAQASPSATGPAGARQSAADPAEALSGGTDPAGARPPTIDRVGTRPAASEPGD